MRCFCIIQPPAMLGNVYMGKASPLIKALLFSSSGLDRVSLLYKVYKQVYSKNLLGHLGESSLLGHVPENNSAKPRIHSFLSINNNALLYPEENKTVVLLQEYRRGNACPHSRQSCLQGKKKKRRRGGGRGQANKHIASTGLIR